MALLPRKRPKNMERPLVPPAPTQIVDSALQARRIVEVSVAQCSVPLYWDHSGVDWNTVNEVSELLQSVGFIVTRHGYCALMIVSPIKDF